MNLENIVTSLEPSQKLAEIGIEQSSLFYWIDPKFVHENDLMIKDAKCFISSGEWLALEPKDNINYYSAFTAQEVWDMIDWDDISVAELHRKKDGMHLQLDSIKCCLRRNIPTDSNLANCLAELVIAQREEKSE